jgi:hypothetical protein
MTANIVFIPSCSIPALGFRTARLLVQSVMGVSRSPEQRPPATQKQSAQENPAPLAGTYSRQSSGVKAKPGEKGRK